MQIAWDVDGVLANFDAAFIAVLNDMFDLKIPENQKPRAWNWFEFVDDLTQDMEARAWEEIQERRGDFWLTMKPLVGFSQTARMNRLSQDHCMVFVTNRRATGMHSNVQQQTRKWLQQRGLDHANNVFLAGGKKGMVGRTLGLHLAVDDDGSSCADYLRHDIPVILLRRPHNEGFVELIKAAPGGYVVESVDAALDLITRWHVRQEEMDEFPVALS